MEASPSPEERVRVYCNDEPVGDLLKIHHAQSVEYGFCYDPSVREGQLVSLAMPAQPSCVPYRGFSQVPYVFQVSLPEGRAIQYLVERFGKGARLFEPFFLLKLVGRGLIGRVTVGGPRQHIAVDAEMVAFAGTNAPAAAWMEQALLRAQAEQFGISGVMPKLQIALPRDRRPETFYLPRHIIKLESPEYFGVCVAEDFALRVARRYGLESVRANLTTAGDALLVDRFDIREDGRFSGFEDACALGGFPSALKYDGCVERLFTMVEQFVREDCVDADKHRLLKLCILNDVLRNGDAHMKNFGLLYDSLEDARLAPVYDVLDTTLFLPEDIPALTLTQYFPDEALKRKHWFVPDDVDALIDIADLPGMHGRHLVQEAADALADVARGYLADLDEAGMRDEERRAWAKGMLDKIGTRLSRLGLTAPRGRP